VKLTQSFQRVQEIKMKVGSFVASLWALLSVVRTAQALYTGKQQEQSYNVETVPNRWIVVFHPGTSDVSDKATTLAKSSNGQVGFVYQHAIEGFVFHGADVQNITNDPNVLSVKRDNVLRITSQSVPTGIRRSYANLRQSFRNATATCFCDAVVAVIDTGVDFNHPELNVNITMSADCSGNPNMPVCVQGLGNDDNGHGTHVAGTIAAIRNTEGVVGVCPGAEIWAVKVLDSNGQGFESTIIAGIDYVTSQGAKVDVANLSLGGPGCSAAICGALDRAKRIGHVAIAVAAGNDNQPAANFVPACCGSVLGK
jgi:subtilisin